MKTPLLVGETLLKDGQANLEDRSFGAGNLFLTTERLVFEADRLSFTADDLSVSLADIAHVRRPGRLSRFFEVATHDGKRIGFGRGRKDWINAIDEAVRQKVSREVAPLLESSIPISLEANLRDERGQYRSRGELLQRLLTAYRQRVADHPEEREAQQCLGAILSALGRNEEAYRTLQDLSQRQSVSPDVMGLVARAAYFTERYHEAKASWERALELDPGFFDNRPEQRALWETTLDLLE